LPVRVLLDECVPRQLRQDLAGHEVRTVREMGWAGVKNGALIENAAERFDAIFTVDADFGSSYRGRLPISILILQVGTNDVALLRPHMPLVNAALATLPPGEIIRLGI
jgi:predicted nuclease of predicted toxin-antitoxin system